MVSPWDLKRSWSISGSWPHLVVFRHPGCAGYTWLIMVNINGYYMVNDLESYALSMII